MKEIIMKLEEDQYETLKQANLNWNEPQTITIGRTLVKVKFDNIDSEKEKVEERTPEEVKKAQAEAKAIEEKIAKEEEEPKDPLDVNKDGKTDLKDVLEVAKGAASDTINKIKKGKKSKNKWK